jgi:LmbE family N-acetylglucosaminyl deacetylase
VRSLRLVEPGETISVLCLGAHADDIEIGAGATILSWIAMGAKLHVRWCVLSGAGSRAAEAQASAASFLQGAA